MANAEDLIQGDAPGAKPASSSKRNLLKTLPGFAISGFFLWYTFRGIRVDQLKALRFVHPAWVVGVLAFTLGSYSLRCVRWSQMMRGTGARLLTCARVLMISLAANNILPLRIGDIMRVFTYASDLGTEPSVILSTVVLEKLLDIFTLVLIFVSTMGSIATQRLHRIAFISLGISAVGLLVLLFGAGLLLPRITALFRRLPQHGVLTKLEHWILLALGATARIGVFGSLLLLLQSAVIWFCEGMIFLSALRLLGVPTDRIGPWLAVSFANLSYLVPSSPGAIGPFELSVKTSLVAHGAPDSQAAVFGLALHAWLLVAVTGAGGLIFLAHRAHRAARKPLMTEIHGLPEELL